MSRHVKHHAVVLGFVLASVSFAPAAQEKKASTGTSLVELRLRAAIKQYDLIWQYYQQSRVETFDVYLWSRLLLDSRKAVSNKPADRLAASQEHLDHMKQLEVLIKKIRRLGFGRSSDVGASEYYRLEAEFWVAEAQAD